MVKEDGMKNTLQEFKDRMSKSFQGMTKAEAIEKRLCVTCKGKATIFCDRLSEREYRITGMCQECQDAIFG